MNSIEFSGFDFDERSRLEFSKHEVIGPEFAAGEFRAESDSTEFHMEPFLSREHPIL